MKKLFFWLMLVLVLIVGFVAYKYLFASKEETKIIEEILEVRTDNIAETIEVVGKAELVDEQSLSFNIVGTITKVNFKAGDSVKKGDIIAEIDNKDAVNNIRDAEISLENAKISLQELYKLPDDNKILQAKNAITQSKENLEISEKELENLKINQENTKTKAIKDIENSKKELDNTKENLESSKKTLELVKGKLELTRKDLDKNLNSTISTRYSTIKNIEDTFKIYLLELEDINTNADYILGVSEENSKKNDDYEIYLGAKNSAYKSEASNLLSKSISKVKELKNLEQNYKYSGDVNEVISIMQKVASAYNETHQMTEALYNAIENSIEGVNLPQTSTDPSKITINGMKSTIGAYRTATLNKITTITSTINTLNTLSDTDLLTETNENAINTQEESIKLQELNISKQEIAIFQIETNIENASKAYNELLANQKIALTSKENEVANREKAVELAETSYSDLVKGPTFENISKTKNVIEQAEIRLDNANKKLEDYRLEAPFDGVIRTIDYMVGDNLKNDTNKYVYIENPNLVEIIVKLDQLDVVNVGVGSEATIVFDAYQDISAKAKVILVDRTPITSDGVVFYQVKLITNDENFDKTIFSGMTASVYLITKSKENVLVLKNDAIKNDGVKKMVLVEKNGVRSEIEVKTGIVGDEMTEIVSGLNEGDKVIYYYEEFVAPKESIMEQKMNEQKAMEDNFRESTGYGS